jgi:hypothetical protein
MKPEQTVASDTKAIPPVMSGPDQKRRAMIQKTLGKAPAEMVTLVERLTSTGTATAREWVLKPISEYRVGQLTSKKFGHIIASDETPEEVMISMLEVWNAGNVAEETGRVGEVDFTKEGDLVYLEHSVRETLTDNQWRGYAALRLGIEPLLNQDIKFEYGDVDEFMNWAGEQADISAVISFARERRTMNVTVLAGLVTAFTASAMREGSL